jgi:uncharacterized protein (TIGR03437 family)
MNIFRIASLLLLASPFASAVVVTLGTSSQAVTFTGAGALPSGQGTGRLSWGACSFDGTNTQCRVSGPYTGLGSGGTYEFLLSYPGNGTTPLTAVSSSAGSNFLDFQALPANGSYLIFSLTPTGGTQRSFYDFIDNLSFTTSTCTGVGNCSVAAVGAISGATITGPVNGQFDVTPRVNTVISAGAYGALSTIAPGTWIEIYGLNLRTISSIFSLGQTWAGSDFNGAQAPTALGETSVKIAGLPAYVDYISPEQVNVQVPSGVPNGSQSLVVTTFGGASASFSVTVAATSPGILAPPAFKLAAGQYAAAQFPDAATFVMPPGSVIGVPQRRAKAGDTITFWGIGFGPVSPNINAGLIEQQANNLSGVQISFAGVPATIQFAGLVQGLVGLYQFNVVVPNVPVSDTVPVVFKLNGTAATQSLLLPIGN